MPICRRWPAAPGWVDPQRLDERVDPVVVDPPDLELVPPRLQRHLPVQPWVGAQERVRHVPDPLGQPLHLVWRQARPVRDPHRAVLEAVRRLFLGDLGRIDVTHAVLPDRAVGTHRPVDRPGRGAPMVVPAASGRSCTTPGGSPDNSGCTDDFGRLLLPGARSVRSGKHRSAVAPAATMTATTATTAAVMPMTSPARLFRTGYGPNVRRWARNPALGSAPPPVRPLS